MCVSVCVWWVTVIQQCSCAWCSHHAGVLCGSTLSGYSHVVHSQWISAINQFKSKRQLRLNTDIAGSFFFPHLDICHSCRVSVPMLREQRKITKGKMRHFGEHNHHFWEGSLQCWKQRLTKNKQRFKIAAIFGVNHLSIQRRFPYFLQKHTQSQK